MNRNKKIGLALIAIPPLLLALVLSGYAITTFIVAQKTPPPTQGIGLAAPADPSLAAFKIARVALGLVGMIAAIGFFAGVPVGVYFLAKKGNEGTPEEIAGLKTNPKYQNLTDEQVKFIGGWSWGAFLATIVWALGNKLWLWVLLSLVPLVNLYVWIKLSISGRKMAWEKGGWDNFEHFRKRQVIMGWVVILFLILAIASQIYAELGEEKATPTSDIDQLIYPYSK